MANRFEKHYTREEARSLLPQVRSLLEKLIQLNASRERTEKRLEALMAPGVDAGGETVNHSITVLMEMQGIFKEFQSRSILIKDLDRGLVDFPAFIGGREVLLCWEMDEPDIEFWHDIDSGFAGREPLQEDL